ncbi:MAG: SDR family NAD(P)-dependent oxidoreductase [Dongiaceae bacterium]
MTISKKVIWITGASSGIGRALALRLAEEGHDIAVSARREEELLHVMEEASSMAGKIIPFTLDVVDAKANQNVAAAIENKLGPIDIAIFGAGYHEEVRLENFKLDTFHRLMDINFFGVVNGVNAVLPSFKRRSAGHIAIISSVAGYRGLPVASAYGATKAALINFAESINFDARHMGIKVQIINPGFVKTPLTDKNRFPMPFLIPAEEAANKIAKGLRRNKFEIAFPWMFVSILKILKQLPDSWYFRLVAKATGK